jgi:3-oxoacyl-[acyl-carrier protein] reductase
VSAREFASEGARFVVTDIDPATTSATTQALRANGADAIGVVADVTKADQVEGLISQAHRTFGRIDVLVNNAGFPRDSLIVKMSESDWDAVIDVVLKGTFLCTRAAVPIMMEQKSGRIINIASRAHLGNPGQANYSSAKAGIIGFTRSQANELGRFNITVNAVAPGFVETPLLRALPHFEKIKQRTIANTPLPRLGMPEDIAAAILFLASERASWVTGEVIHVTGGRYSN